MAMKIHLDIETYHPPRSGLLLLQCVLGAFFCVFVLQFWYLQIHKGAEYAQLSRDNRLRQEKVFASRGLIRDTNGVLLADNQPAFGLSLIREECADIPSTLAKASVWLDIPLDELTEKFNQDSRKVQYFEPVLLHPDMTFEQVAQIEAQLIHWPGLEITTRVKRTYPHKDVFAHLLGYVAEANEKELSEDAYLALGDTVGKQGLEYVLEKTLRGKKGQMSMEVDVLGRVFERAVDEKPQSGTNIHLTLDASLQQAITEILGDQTGSVVVMDASTRAVRALVTTPSYDNNLFVRGLSHAQWSELRNNPKNPLLYRGIQSVYPPASVWKLLMAGLFLKEGISPDETVYCSGETKLGPQTFRCWRKGGHGKMNMMQALIDSCDVYFYIMGEKVGIDKIEAYAKASGFGELTGIGIPNEKSGLVPSKAWKRRRMNEPWYRGETYNVSIGQGYTLTTPLQVASFLAALVDDGVRKNPRIQHNEPLLSQGNLPITSEHRAFILESMRQTVLDGTARVLKRENIDIGGKTGTAQVVSLRMDGDERIKNEDLAYFERDHAWMASWGKYGDDHVIVVVMVEHGGGGSSVAGPIARQVYDILYEDVQDMQVVSQNTPQQPIASQ